MNQFKILVIKRIITVFKMVYCNICGAEIDEDTKFCATCGASVAQRESIRRHKKVDESKACFGPAGSGVGVWGSISFGIFLLGVGILWFLDALWPGIIILIGLMVIIGGIIAYSRR